MGKAEPAPRSSVFHGVFRSHLPPGGSFVGMKAIRTFFDVLTDGLSASAMVAEVPAETDSVVRSSARDMG